VFENTAAAELVLGRSTVRQRILALLLPESAARLHLREIQRRVGTSPGTASRELAKLVAAGLIEREQEGAQVYFKASGTPFAAMMRSLLALAPPPTSIPRPARVRPVPGNTAGAPASTTAPETGRGTTTDPAETPARIADDRAPGNIVATTGAALDGPLEDVVASAISQLTAAASSPTSRPLVLPTPAGQDVPPRIGQAERAAAQARRGDETTAPGVPDRTDARAAHESWTGVADPALIDIIRRRAAADPLGLKIARRLADSVESIYGERLRGMYLFGIRAAGPADPSADVETLIVLDRVDKYGAELERTSHACAALSHEFGIIVSRVFVSEQDWSERTDGSLPMVRSEAVVA